MRAIKYLEARHRCRARGLQLQTTARQCAPRNPTPPATALAVAGPNSGFDTATGPLLRVWARLKPPRHTVAMSHEGGLVNASGLTGTSAKDSGTGESYLAAPLTIAR